MPILDGSREVGRSGAAAVFKIYVVLTTGNEKGSNVARIISPGM